MKRNQFVFVIIALIYYLGLQIPHMAFTFDVLCTDIYKIQYYCLKALAESVRDHVTTGLRIAWYAM
jgi:hypothetical protein